MQVDEALINKLAHLSMLDFNDEERVRIAADLQRMIGFIDQLRQVDTTGVEPLLHMTEATDVLRPDVPAQMISREEALRNAPLHDNMYFKVPKAIRKPE